MRNPKEVEYSFLGCIFDNPYKRISEAFDLGCKLDWFSDVICRLVWTSIEAIRKRNELATIKPLVIITEALKITNRKKSPFAGLHIGPKFIEEARRFRDATPEGEAKTIAAYAPILRDAAIGRQLDKAMSLSMTEGSFSSNAARMMSLAKQIQDIQKSESPDTGIDIGDLLDNMQETYDKGYEEYKVKKNYNYIPGIPYPWEEVSHMTEGLSPGLHIVAARPSVGKTSYVLQCMMYWCELGYKVAFDCLDMSVTEMIKRPVANYARVSPKRAKFGWASPEEMLRVKEASEKIRAMGNAGLLELTVNPDVDSLKSWAEIRHKAGKLDILVIDYAQRFKMKGVVSEYEIVTYIAGVLKQLANECLIPVILLSQLSRDNVKNPKEQRTPELSDLRGSGALEQDATTVVLLHKVSEVNSNWHAENSPDPPTYFVPTEKGIDPRAIIETTQAISAVCWNLAKNQNGETGMIPFVVFQNWFRWYVGNAGAKNKSEYYTKIMADWRCEEEPFKTAENNHAVIYPEHWDAKYAITCARLGLELPPKIRDRVSDSVLKLYHDTLKEYQQRKQTALENEASAPARMAEFTATPTPSLATAAAAPHSASTATAEDTPPSRKGIISTELNTAIENHRMPNEADASGEPQMEDEFDDEQF